MQKKSESANSAEGFITNNDTGSKPEPVFIRTVIRRDVYDQLKQVAQQYETGQGYWDFGVAIQILLDNYYSTRVQSVTEKLDLLLSIQTQNEVEQPPEQKYIEMLGGSKIEV